MTGPPLIGHGTGSVPVIFQRYAAAHPPVVDPDDDVSHATNPHNQTLAIALQLGFLGTIALYGMWFVHGAMFRRLGIAAWFGIVVVTQNFVGSLVNSHLSDFTQGWTYAVCVGVAGGMVLRQTWPGSVEFTQDAAAGRIAKADLWHGVVQSAELHRNDPNKARSAPL